MCIKQENSISVCLYGCLGKGFTLPNVNVRSPKKGCEENRCLQKGFSCSAELDSPPTTHMCLQQGLCSWGAGLDVCSPSSQA